VVERGGNKIDGEKSSGTWENIPYNRSLQMPKCNHCVEEDEWCLVVSKEFKVKVRVHQGSMLRPFLFIIVVEVLTNSLKLDLPWDVKEKL